MLRTVTYLERKILERLTGLISRNLIVPPENSEDRIDPPMMIITTLIRTTIERTVSITNQKSGEPQ